MRRKQNKRDAAGGSVPFSLSKSPSTGRNVGMGLDPSVPLAARSA